MNIYTVFSVRVSVPVLPACTGTDRDTATVTLMLALTLTLALLYLPSKSASVIFLRSVIAVEN